MGAEARRLRSTIEEEKRMLILNLNKDIRYRVKMSENEQVQKKKS